MALRTSELTDAIDAAFKVEWAKQNKFPLPEAGSQDRRLLFAAVARGLLTYLQANEDEIFKSVTLRILGGNEITYTVTDTNLDIFV